MGWKKFKEHFKIEHIVQITEKGLLIGSSYVPDLVSINLESGIVKEENSFKGFLEKNYPNLLKENSLTIKALLDSPDSFKKSIKVYTYSDEGIIEETAEEIGFPNVTHLGHLMYENTYFVDRKKCVEAAMRNNQLKIEYAKDKMINCEKELIKCKEELKQLEEKRKKIA